MRTALRDDLGRFSSLYRQHAVLVRAAIERLGVPSWRVEAAVQDVFVAADRQLGSIDDDEAFEVGVVGLAVSVAARHRRNAAERARRNEWLRARVGLTARELPWHSPASVELLRILGARLGPGRRDAFVLCEVHGLDVAAAAHVLGVNRNIVAVRLRSARHELLRVLLDELPPASAAPATVQSEFVRLVSRLWATRIWATLAFACAAAIAAISLRAAERTAVADELGTMFGTEPAIDPPVRMPTVVAPPPRPKHVTPPPSSRMPAPRRASAPSHEPTIAGSH